MQIPVTALAAACKAFSRICPSQLTSGVFTQFQPGKDNSDQQGLTDGREDSLLFESRELRSLHAKTMADFQQAARAASLASQWLHVFFVQFDCYALHDLFECQHNPETALLPYNDAFHPGEGTRADPRKLPYTQERMRFDPMLHETSTQRFNRTVRKRRRLTPGTPNHCQRSGDTQDTDTLRTLNTHKDITGEERQIQRHTRPVAPFTIRLIER